MEELWGHRYMVATSFSNLDQFCGPVMYVDDVGLVYSRSIRKQVDVVSNTQTMHIDKLPELPRHKSLAWKFQEEYRFSLFILPTSAMRPDGPGVDSGDFITSVSQSFLDGTVPPLSHFDVALSPTALSNMVVRTGPMAGPGTVAIVEALLTAHCPDAKLETSALTGSIRDRP